MNACDSQPKKTANPYQKRQTAVLKCLIEMGLTCLLCLIACSAQASTIPVSVDGYIVPDRDASFNVFGPSLNLYSSTADYGNSFLTCQEGVACDATMTVPASYSFQQFINYPSSDGSLGPLDAGILAGYMTFSGGSVIIPVGDPDPSLTLTATLSGDIQGYQVLTGDGSEFYGSEFYSLGSLLFDVQLTGSVSCGFSGITEGAYAYFQNGNCGGNATAYTTPNVPEPGTLGLLAFGSLGLALWRRKVRSTG